MEIIEYGTKKDGITYGFRETCYGIAENDDKILMVYSEKGKDISFPGGGIEQGETLTDGLKREFLEESGYEVLEAEPIVDAHVFAKTRKGDYIERFAHFFKVKINLEDPKTPTESWHKLMWIEKSKATETNTHPVQIQVLQKFNLCSKEDKNCPSL